VLDLESRSCQREVVALPPPPAGAGFTRQVSGADTWRVLAVTFQLVTSAGVANRVPRVEYVDGSGVVFAVAGAPFIQAGALTTLYSFSVGAQQFGAAGAAAVGGPLPDLELDVSMAIRVAVAAVQAADQISRVRLYVEQYNERP
jgi:hypothetical protein